MAALLLARGGGLFDGAGLALALGENFLSASFVKNLLDAVLAGFFIDGEPLALVAGTCVVEIGFDRPELLRYKAVAFFFALHDNGKRRSLHTSAWRNLEPAHGAVVGGESAASVHAYEPVGFATAEGGVPQVHHVFFGTEVLECVLDGGRRHALHPKSLECLALEVPLEDVVHDVIENQFTFAARIARVYNRRHVLALDELAEGGEMGFCGR